MSPENVELLTVSVAFDSLRMPPPDRRRGVALQRSRRNGQRAEVVDRAASACTAAGERHAAQRDASRRHSP